MKNYLIIKILSLSSLFLLAIVLISSMQPKKTVNIETLLHDMIDRDLVASFPERDFRLKQESSYNRASVSPNDTEGWFNNKDLNNNDTDRNLLELKKIMETENGY